MADETKIQWHPAFCSAMELTLLDNAESLDYDSEYNLSRKPLQVDLLVIHKEDDTPVKDEVGRVFRQYNILEYKSPGDDLTIDTYYKVVAYGCLLKVQKSNTVNATKQKDITLTMVRREKPEKMLNDLVGEGIEVSSDYPGIYHLHGNTLFETQIIVTRELPPGTHIWLKSLTRNLEKEEAKQFVSDMEKFPAGSRERKLADSVLQVTLSANRETFEELKKEDPIMCNALKELMRPEIEAEFKEREITGAINLARKMNMTEHQIEDYLVETFKITREEAEKYLEPVSA